MSRKTSWKRRVADWLSLVLFFPVIGFALNFLVAAISEFLEHPLALGGYFWGQLQFLVHLLFPLAVAAGVIWLLNHKGAPRIGAIIGIFSTLIIFVSYVLLLPRCNSNFACGEVSGFIIILWVGMFIADAIAAVRLGYWIERLSAGRSSLSARNLPVQ
jgi:hypothetical protein